jgi:hypothetical protein
MLESGASGTVGGEGGNLLAYPAVSGVADRTPAAQNITSRFTASRTLSAGSATRCGNLRLRSPR